jgi:glycerate-2-kinase
VTDQLRGEARVLGARLAALGLSLRRDRATLLLAGGEPTVTVRGAGRGGRAQELALAAALALEGAAGVTLLAAGTDGSDGPTEAAGAYADGSTIARGAAQGATQPRRSLRTTPTASSTPRAACSAPGRRAPTR